MFSNARRALLACAAAAAWLNAAPALADTAWPDKPVRLIVPYTPGGATDIVARLVAQKLADDTKWTFIVDNRAGGNGNIGMDVVAKAKPDGYTIGLGQTANLAINPTLFPKMPYDALKDLAPVSVVASQPVVLVVRADAPFKSLADLVAAAKAKPGESARRSRAPARWATWPARCSPSARASRCSTCRTRAPRRPSPTCSVARPTTCSPRRRARCRW
ncbi:tripartite-type tricarboxylate transporter receptor subunit TctC [Variovorax guangxiensis]|uniref:Tripartite-type tricarboxylate transporter receptor subunit TctC n=1 Tax=Variovorax guangxiensis TaxID=1775474 RepID=A0A840FVD2_9BURK|nr:tripartite-type tricarboxylate transporter receptor subunit TctC [Variovorax guangxiensis]